MKMNFEQEKTIRDQVKGSLLWISEHHDGIMIGSELADIIGISNDHLDMSELSQTNLNELKDEIRGQLNWATEYHSQDELMIEEDQIIASFERYLN